MAIVHYKGFEISPAPYKLIDSGEWELRVVITKHSNSRGETIEQPYTGSNSYVSKEDAEVNAVEFGKGIIDGIYPNLTIRNLL